MVLVATMKSKRQLTCCLVLSSVVPDFQLILQIVSVQLFCYHLALVGHMSIAFMHLLCPIIRQAFIGIGEIQKIDVAFWQNICFAPSSISSLGDEVR